MFRLLLLAALVGINRAIVCTPEICGNDKFDVSQCKGSVIKGGGFCGCTDACAKVEGQVCQATIPILRGVPPQGTCDVGLQCVSSNSGFNLAGAGTCQKTSASPRTPCQKMQMSLMSIRAPWKPKCDAHGNFTPKQCDNKGACFCVDVHSGKILSENHNQMHGLVSC